MGQQLTDRETNMPTDHPDNGGDGSPEPHEMQPNGPGGHDAHAGHEGHGGSHGGQGKHAGHHTDMCRRRF